MAKSKSHRIKSQAGAAPIITWQQAEQAVREIGDLQLSINASEASCKKQIDQAKACLTIATKPTQRQIKELTRRLEAFAAQHRTEFGKRQSKKLIFGTLGWRKSVVISVAKTTLEKIKQVFSKRASRYIHVKESVDKEALAKLMDEQLASISARRKRKEVFFVEPDIPEAVDYE